MKWIFWNIRGVGNLDTQIHLFHMLKKHKPDILFLAEPLISFNSIPSWYWNKLNLHHHAINISKKTPTLWCLWNNKYTITILLNKAQCIAFTYVDEGTPTFIAAIYASTLYINRRELWFDLSYLLNEHTGPWLFFGDFNSILGAHEKLGGRIPLQIACNEFLQWTSLRSLIHLDTSRAKYTWVNKREGGAFIAQRLDRAICNEKWITGLLLAATLLLEPVLTISLFF